MHESWVPLRVSSDLFRVVSLMADGSMLAAAKLLEPLAERVGHLEHVTQAGSLTGHSKDNGSPLGSMKGE